MGKILTPYIGSGFVVLVAVFIMLTKPFSVNMSDTAHIMLGGVIITLSIWVFRPFNLPYAVGGLFLAMFALILGLAPSVVFSGFTQTALWTLVPALFFGYTLQKTGLGKRVAMSILKLCKPSYNSLIFAWVMIGIILSILTPSITVRIAIVIPIAIQCCMLCNLEKGSKGNSLILLTAFAMALIPGSGWLTGTILGPLIQGFMDMVPGLEGLVTFNSWFSVMFLPVTITTILLIVSSLFVLKPEDEISKDAIDAIKTQSLEKMSRQEVTAAVILVTVFVMFLTSGLHGLSIPVLCLAALIAFFVFGVLETKDFSEGINWDLVVFMAMALSLGAIFTETGISQWLAGIVVPALAPIAGNPWTFMFGVMAFMFMWRFVDVAMFIPTIAIVIPMLPAIQEAYNISPLVWLAIFILAGNAFFMAYQNIWAMMSRSIAEDRIWDDKHLGMYGILYFIACLIALAVAIPMWINAGLFG